MWIGIFCGGVFTAYLMSYKVKSSMMVGIAFVTILSWPYVPHIITCRTIEDTDSRFRRDTSFTYFPATELGEDRWNFFKKVVNFYPIQTLNVLDWNISQNSSHFVLALFTFLY